MRGLGNVAKKFAIQQFHLCRAQLLFLQEPDHLPEKQEENNWQPCVLAIHNFASAFLFSVETQHTIGYGTRQTTEKCPEAIFLQSLQSVVGVIIQVKNPTGLFIICKNGYFSTLTFKCVHRISANFTRKFCKNRAKLSLRQGAAYISCFLLAGVLISQ